MRIERASEPEDGSVRAKAASLSPESNEGRKRRFCSPDPNWSMASATVLWIPTLIAVLASAAPASSIAMA